MDKYNLVSLAGIFILVGLAWVCSSNRRIVNWRVIGWGIALQIAVLGLVALVNLALGGIGDLANPLLGTEGKWSLGALFGYLFYPLTLVLGVPPSDAGVISRIIGERLIVTEVAAYGDLAAAIDKGLLQHPRSAVIATYALCGFAHVPSMAIFVGSICALAPERAKGIGPIAIRALVAATLACLMTPVWPERSLQMDQSYWVHESRLEKSKSKNHTSQRLR